jgi:ABC-2 type transport system permease protein
MENLLATPVRPFEVMVGKIAPYVVIGYIQLGVILAAAALLFDVPMEGSLVLLLAMIGVFMLANLAVGFTFSTLAKNQLQAMQMTFFFFLPSMLLSGFMFPFRGMPEWAQKLGEVLPLTHFHAEGPRRGARAAGAVAAAGVSVRRRGCGVEAVSADVGLRWTRCTN